MYNDFGVITIVKVNDIAEITITDMTVNGDGIGKTSEGYPLFTAGAVVGDKIKVQITKTNKTYGFAKILNITEPSPCRTKPICPYFEKCGGCNIMHMSYDAQLEVKKNIVSSNLAKIGQYPADTYEYEGIIGADDTLYYRNKAQFPVGFEKGNAICGFYQKSSHKIVPASACYIQDKDINKAVSIVMDYIRKHKISVYNEEKHKGIIRHIYVRCGGGTDNPIMVVIVTNSSTPLPHTNELADLLKDSVNLKSLVQNINTKKGNTVLGYENITLWGDSTIKATISDIDFVISPNSFFQVNYAQMQKLYSKAKEYARLDGSQTVFDLYCGVGSISLFMADKAKKVVGVEIVEAAIENAKANAKANNITNTEFYCGDCAKVVKDLVSNGYSADVIIVDPPRKGCDEDMLSLINTVQPEKVVYVSCNSATLARDVDILKNYGYIMQKCCAVDMFPNSMHVETVVLLSQLKPDDIIEVDIDLDELDITSSESKATYEEIKAYVLDKYGFKVSSLYIAQIKTKYGIKDGVNYNISKKGSRVPACPPEKENAITEALKYFKMID